jgi:16S rRNA (cytosine967-C5)-methyltransferase
VIRRHPDIKWLRRESDLDSLADRQARLLDGVWPTVAPGGYLLYCTCSVFDAENAGRVAPFLERNPDARAVSLAGAVAGAIDCRVGVQILTGDDGRDGFYYALIQKTA